MFNFVVNISDSQIQNMLDDFFDQSDGVFLSMTRRPNVDTIPVAIVEEISGIGSFELTRPLIMRGLQLLVDMNRPVAVNIIQDDWDWADVECLLQYALFGKEIY